jgi:hypothetical protein
MCGADRIRTCRREGAYRRGGGLEGYLYVCGVNDVFMRAECRMSRTIDRYLEAGEIPTETWL